MIGFCCNWLVQVLIQLFGLQFLTEVSDSSRESYDFITVSQVEHNKTDLIILLLNLINKYIKVITTIFKGRSFYSNSIQFVKGCIMTCLGLGFDSVLKQQGFWCVRQLKCTEKV